MQYLAGTRMPPLAMKAPPLVQSSYAAKTVFDDSHFRLHAKAEASHSSW
jgi:hypothetical protein